MEPNATGKNNETILALPLERRRCNRAGWALSEKQGLGSNPGEDMDVSKCIVPLRHGGALNSRRAASPFVWLVEGEERLRPTTVVHLAPSHDEFRGPRFDFVRYVALVTTRQQQYMEHLRISLGPGPQRVKTSLCDVVVANATCLTKSERGPRNSSWQEVRLSLA
ncbi:hypothetical protein TNCV_4425451 [Trichonephila clavipes]|nr:hypothetical protein TNCV_4425451 [Trichonephila clavipes]